MHSSYTPTTPPFKDEGSTIITVTQEDGQTKTMAVSVHMLPILIQDGLNFVEAGKPPVAPDTGTDTVSDIPTVEEFKAMDKAAILVWVEQHDPTIPVSIITMMEKQDEDSLRAIMEAGFGYLRDAEAKTDAAPDPLPSEHDFDAMDKDQLVEWMVKHKGHEADETILRTTLEAQSEEDLRGLAHLLHN